MAAIEHHMRAPARFFSLLRTKRKGWGLSAGRSKFFTAKSAKDAKKAKKN
jgi:hypothetical protein